MLLKVPNRAREIPHKNRITLIAIFNFGNFKPSSRLEIIIERMYIIGGNTNIINDPKTAPDKEPTAPISEKHKHYIFISSSIFSRPLNRDARKPIKINKIADIRFTSLIPANEGIFSASEMNQFRITKKIRGKLASTEVPKAISDIAPSGSAGENEFKANELDCLPTK
jgi:hypothetical protein